MSSVEEFRTEVRSGLRAHLTGEFATLKGRGGPGREPWSRRHRELGELAMDVCAAASLLAAGAHGDPYAPDDRQRLFPFSRADTICAGSDEIRRTLIAERILGLPKEVRA
ncbi:acyl-CoA dehydrogenase family protein [Streptomyces sp. NRRL F-2580]|uniref:acyl-CoA dehydrogenase family protein n=1 Tax=Streptomyces sp. NRRL F-2580 TaxID=1463841 RepID=UPI0004CB9924